VYVCVLLECLKHVLCSCLAMMYQSQYCYVSLHIQVQLQSEEVGKHLSEVETLLQQHNMLGTSLEAYKQHITQVNQQAGLYTDKKYANSNEKCEHVLCMVLLQHYSHLSVVKIPCSSVECSIRVY